MKRAITIVVVVAILLGGGFWLKGRMGAKPANGQTKFKVSQVETGTVKKTVSATGTIQPYTTVDIKSKAGGRVVKMHVDVGTVVHKNDIICEIDPADTQLSVDQAQADIDSARARQRSSEQTWKLGLRQSELAVQTAETTLASNKASLAAANARLTTADKQRSAQPRLTSASIESARANYDSAQKQLTQLVEATHPQGRASAEASLAESKANLVNSEKNLARQRTLLQKGFVSQQVVDQALASRDVQAAQVAAAQRKMDTIDREQKAEEAAQRSRVAQAKAQMENAEAQSVDVDVREQSYQEARASVAQYKQQVANAERALDLAKANLANNDIRRQDIFTANATKARAQAALTNAQKTLDQTVVRAPCDGVVLTKYVEEGTIISSALSFAATGNNIVQLGDTTKLYVDVTVDETDIANVDVDQDVDVTVDAYPSVPLQGKVSRIDPQAKLENNVTDVHVRVELDSGEQAFQLLMPGMNATCEFVNARKADVVMVPTEAVRTDDKGRYIETASGGTPAPPDPKTGAAADPSMKVGVKTKKLYDEAEIKLGLEGNDSVEVERGLKAGDSIVTQRIEPVEEQAGGAFGGMQMGPRGGRR